MMTRDSETTVTLMMTLLHHDLLTLNGHVAVNNQQLIHVVVTLTTGKSDVVTTSQAVRQQAR